MSDSSASQARGWILQSCAGLLSAGPNELHNSIWTGQSCAGLLSAGPNKGHKQHLDRAELCRAVRCRLTAFGLPQPVVSRLCWCEAARGACNTSSCLSCSQQSVTCLEGADVLRDAANLVCCHRGGAQGVQERGLHN